MHHFGNIGHGGAGGIIVILAIVFLIWAFSSNSTKKE